MPPINPIGVISKLAWMVALFAIILAFGGKPILIPLLVIANGILPLLPKMSVQAEQAVKSLESPAG